MQFTAHDMCLSYTSEDILENGIMLREIIAPQTNDKRKLCSFIFETWKKQSLKNINPSQSVLSHSTNLCY